MAIKLQVPEGSGNVLPGAAQQARGLHPPLDVPLGHALVEVLVDPGGPHGAARVRGRRPVDVGDPIGHGRSFLWCMLMRIQ